MPWLLMFGLINAIGGHRQWQSLVQVMAKCGIKFFPEPVMIYFWWGTQEHVWVKVWIIIYHLLLRNFVNILSEPQTYIFIKNVVAVAAYSWLASRSQAKFQTMKLSPLSAPCAATPAQSTISTCRPLRFSPRSCEDVNLNTHCPSGLPRQIRASKRR